MKQLSFFSYKVSKVHGGSLNDGKRNELRPVDSQKLLHLVLKSKALLDLVSHNKFIKTTIRRQAKLAGVKIYRLSVQRDHIHHSISFSNRHSYKKFVRCVTSLMGRKLGRGLWKYRPYTRVVEWGRDARNLNEYIDMNELEVRGIIPYQKR